MSKKVIKSMRLDEEIIKAIEKIALKENRTFSNMVESILKEYSEKN